VTLQLINLADLPSPSTYTQVVVTTGGRLVFIAGQEPEDAGGNLTGPGDLAAQAGQVFTNLGRALSAAGARPDQVAKITIYAVGYRPEFLPVIERARLALFGGHKPARVQEGSWPLNATEWSVASPFDEIRWENWSLRVPPLELQRRVEIQRQRLDRVAAIDAFTRGRRDGSRR
jgi:enamine deaminase RidA (YjgF/YER057c/UK114 family)